MMLFLYQTVSRDVVLSRQCQKYTQQRNRPVIFILTHTLSTQNLLFAISSLNIYSAIVSFFF